MTFEQFLHIFLLPLSIAAIGAYFVSPMVIYLYKTLGWLDDPRKQKHVKVVHTYAVPRGGGIVIFAGLFVGILVFLELNKYTVGILAGALLLTVIGVIDDVKNINPYWRLFFGVLAALVVVGVGIGIAFVSNPFGEGVIHLNEPQIPIYILGKLRTIWVWADVLAVLWIIWCMNMVNWSKGLDGQLPGVVVVAATIIAVLSFRFTEDVTQWDVSILAGITAGAFLGFLPWNFFPQKMMPGYGAGSLAGYLLAVLSILSGAKLATLILVLGVPMIDAGFVIVRRILRGKSPVWGDRSHFHHLLMDIGWSKQRIAVFYWAAALIFGFVALYLNPRQKVFTIGLLILSYGILLLWLKFFFRSSKR